MKINDLLNQLEQQGAWDTDREPEKKWLKEYIVDTLKEYFEMFYEESLTRWRNENDNLIEPIDLPDEYIDFLWQAKFESAQLSGPYGMAVFCWTTMLYRTINWMNVHGNEHGPRYWINIAERGDKGYIYLCCDTSCKHYGKVLEFYDDAPWNGNDNIPGPEEECDECMTFEEFLTYSIERFGKKS